MAHFVKRIARAGSAKLASYAGPSGELTMDTTTNDLVLQTGQVGGVRLAKAATPISATNGVEIIVGGTVGQATTVSGVDASVSGKGVVQLSNATNSSSQTQAATPKAVADALQEAKDYADTAGAPYTGSAPIAVDAATRVISAMDATTAAKGVVQVGDNVTANNGVISVKPWAIYSATAADVDVSTVQEGALIQTDEPVGGDLTAVIAQVETGATLSGLPSVVPSSYTVQQNAANRDVSNLTAIGKEALAHAAMPSGQYIDLPVPAHGSTVIAPADGWMFFNAHVAGGGWWGMSSQGLLVQVANNAGGYGLADCLPVKKDAQVTFAYYNISNASTRFYYANGSAPTV